MKHPVRNAIIVLLVCFLVYVPFGCFRTIRIPPAAIDRITVTGNGGKALALISDPSQRGCRGVASR